MTTAHNALAALIGEADATGSKERHAAVSILLRVVMGDSAKAVLSDHTAVIGPRAAHIVAREIEAIIEKHGIR
jgi:ABC-type uncharacterized transport system ATPase component